VRHPGARAQAAKTLLAVAIVVAVVVAFPRGDGVETGEVASGDRGAAQPPDDVGRLLAERWAVQEAAAELEPVSPELAAPVFDSPAPPETLDRAMEVVTRFLVEYASYRYDETDEQRAARLAPLMTDEAARLLTSGSTALAERQAMHKRREVAVAEVTDAQPLEVTASRMVFLVGVRVNISTIEGDRTLARVYRVTLAADGADAWLLDQLAF
jgi:hypothetical protein